MAFPWLAVDWSMENATAVDRAINGDHQDMLRPIFELMWSPLVVCVKIPIPVVKIRSERITSDFFDFLLILFCFTISIVNKLSRAIINFT